jgi:integral membrane protein
VNVSATVDLCEPTEDPSRVNQTHKRPPMISNRGFISLGRWEAFSLIALLGVAMPLKYIYGYPLAVRVVGMSHGILFIVYVTLAAVLARAEGWSLPKLIRCWIASCLPLGTLFFERELSGRD